MQVTWLWAAPYPRPAHQQNDEGFVSVGAEMVLHTSCVARSNAPLRMAASLWITFGRRRVRPFTPIPAIRRPNSGLVVGGLSAAHWRWNARPCHLPIHRAGIPEDIVSRQLRAQDREGSGDGEVSRGRPRQPYPQPSVLRPRFCPSPSRKLPRDLAFTD